MCLTKSEIMYLLHILYSNTSKKLSPQVFMVRQLFSPSSVPESYKH